jgi:molybdate transport system regulatory protein
VRTLYGTSWRLAVDSWRENYHWRVYSLRPRIRVVSDDGTIVLGPGKADLLDAIARTGSIRAAADELGMSYMRAWNLVKTMNAAFRSPLVEKERGGAGQGGAQLTTAGLKVLRLYRKIEDRAARATEPLWEKMKEQL